MVVYIAGPMTGTEDMGRARFRETARRLRGRGDIPLNPAELPEGMREESYLPICLAMLREADAILLLDGWQGSAGALAEYHFALKTDKRIIWEEELE